MAPVNDINATARLGKPWLGSIRTLGYGFLTTVWCLVAYWATSSHDQTIQSSRSIMQQSVAVLKEQARQTFGLLRISLFAADQWLQTHPTAAPGENQEFARLIEGLRQASEHRADIRLVTKDGKLVYIPQRPDAAHTDVSDREYFRVQQDPATRGFHVAAPVFSRVTKKWGIPISISASTNGGGISVLFGAVELDTLAALQTPLIHVPSERSYLIRDDGMVLSSIPFLQGFVGKSIASTQEWAGFTGQEGIVEVEHAPSDDRQRIVAYSRLEDYHIVAVRSVALDEVLKPWRNAVGVVVSIALLTSLILVVLTEKLAHSARVIKFSLATVTAQAQALQEANNQLEILAVTDKLTLLFNRVKLDKILVQEIERSNRYQHAFSLMLLDIDYFKLINDTYGHDVGDETLQRLADILRNNTRNVDTVGRWGGEEFMVILPDTTSEDARLCGRETS
jgi:GAF domain-containing protein